MDATTPQSHLHHRKNPRSPKQDVNVWVSGLSFLGIFCRMAWRNLWRNPLRSGLTLSALAGGMMVLIFYAGLMKGMMQHLVVFATEVSTGHLQVHRAAFRRDQDVYATMPWAWLSEMERALPTFTFSPRAYGAGLISSAHASLGVSIQAVMVDKEIETTRFLNHTQAGQFGLSPAGSVQHTGTPNTPMAGVALGAQLARQLKVTVADEVVLMTQAADGSIGNNLYRVSAIFKPLSPAFDRGGVVMHMTDFQELMVLTQGFHELVVQSQDPSTVTQSAVLIETVITNLTAQEPLDQLGGSAQVRTWQTLVPMASEMLALSGGIMFMVGAVLAGLAALGMVNTMLMAMHERTYELGILRAVGLTPRAVSALVLLEAFFLGVLATIIGAVLGVVVTLMIGRTGIDFSGALPEGYDWGGMVFEPVMPVVLDAGMILPAAAFMVCLTLLAVVFPVRRTLKCSPVELLS